MKKEKRYSCIDDSGNIYIQLEDPTAKGKIFSLRSKKFYDSKQKLLQDNRKEKINKINNE